MPSETGNVSQMKKVIFGTIAAISICALLFSAMSQGVKASLVNQSKTVPTNYAEAVSNSQKNTIPAGYVKAAYQTKLLDTSGQPGPADISMADAAEIGAQNLWRLFGVNLEGKTIEMSYSKSSTFNPRAEWEGIIFIDKIPRYSFLIDAVTGDYRATQQSKYWQGNINTGMNMELMKNHQRYAELAKETAQKFQLVSGHIISAEYYSQGYSSFGNSVNPDITMLVKTDTGQQAQLTFSRYNQEFLSVEYDAWVKDARVYEAQMEKEIRQKASYDIQDIQLIPNIK